MLQDLLYAIAGRCPTHDRASAYRIAQLEVQEGIGLDAMAKHQAQAVDIVEAYSNPAITDCGRKACRHR